MKPRRSPTSAWQCETPGSIWPDWLIAITLAPFGPQAPLQALEALAIEHATFTAIYVGSAAAAAALAGWLALTEASAAGRPDRR